MVLKNDFRGGHVLQLAQYLSLFAATPFGRGGGSGKPTFPEKTRYRSEGVVQGR